MYIMLCRLLPINAWPGLMYPMYFRIIFNFNRCEFFIELHKLFSWNIFWWHWRKLNIKLYPMYSRHSFRSWCI